MPVRGALTPIPSHEFLRVFIRASFSGDGHPAVGRASCPSSSDRQDACPTRKQDGSPVRSPGLRIAGEMAITMINRRAGCPPHYKSAGSPALRGTPYCEQGGCFLGTLKTSRSLCRLALPVLGLLIALVLPCWAAGTQSSAIPGLGQSVQTSTTVQTQIGYYIAAGYSIFGPAQLASVTSSSLVFPGEFGTPGLTVTLSNKTVSVLNEAGASVPFSILGPGTNVIVCYKNDSVVIFALQSGGTGVGNVQSGTGVGHVR